jgi:hypothetical protein
MPYIKEDSRIPLDECINDMITCLQLSAFKASKQNNQLNNLSNKDFLNICGDINYTFSRILGGLMGEPSYSKIALITGVLENIKQEFYRRVAASYENTKINENGDIKEYRRFR